MVDDLRGGKMKQHIVEFGKYKTRVCEWGDQSKPQLICIHGLGSTNLSFIEIAALLQGTYHILSFDLPGHGHAPAFDSDEAYAADHLMTWVEELLNQIGAETFNILAHSWGASVALHYAAIRPDKVKRMVLLDGGYHDFDKQDDYFKERINDLRDGYQPTMSLEESIDYYEKDFYEYIFDNKIDFLRSERNSYTRFSPLLGTAVFDLMKESDGKIKWHANGDTARAVVKFQYKVYETIKFEKIKADVLLLYVDMPKQNTEIRLLMIETFSKRFNVTTKLYPDTTHLMHWDRPMHVAQDVYQWLEMDSQKSTDDLK